LPSIGHEGILRSHPDLSGKIALLGLLTTESTKEQLAAELNTLTVAERATLNDLNEKYKNKFGFPFVICARENKKAAILNGMATRLHNSHATELQTGVTEVKKIAFYRLLDLIKHTEAESKL
jgi:2-oxo-4-hydroxy-4-carboxy-5-ureidoimidazoline decarboxylase